MPNKYVPDNSYLTCDKGSAPCRLKVTHANSTKIYGEYMASEADMVPGENIFPMGTCSVTGGPCKPDPIYWDKTMLDVKVNGYKMLVDEAHLLCKQGGKVGISMNAPDGAISAMLGVAYSTNKNATKLADNFAERADLLKNIEAENLNGKTVDEIARSRGDFKRLYGEENIKLDLKAKGYNITSRDMGQGQNGLDISATDPKGTTDIVSDGKFSSRGNKPVMDRTASGKQMSDNWLTRGERQGTSRVQQGMGAEDAQRVLDKLSSGDESLKRVAGKVEPNGKVTYHAVDNAGNVLGEVEISAANVVKSTSKAGDAINAVSRSIQSAKAMSAANNFLVRNAGTVSKVGKVVGKTALVVGIALETYHVYSAYKEEGHFGKKTKEATGSAVGSLAGGIAGAELGATIGVIGGPVGVIVGGVVGGIIGGIAGSSLGKAIADWF